MSDRTRQRDSSRVAAIRLALARQHLPRLQMFAIVLLTGMAGFLASFLMLHMGVTGMALRYLLALCVAYLMFLFILWVWLRWGADGLDVIEAGADGLDVIEAGADALEGQGPALPGWDGNGGNGGNGDTFDVDAIDPGDAGIPLFAAALIAGVACCALFVVYAAPLLFAELLVDGILSASLYRRLCGIDRHHWLETALRRTVWPFVFAAVSVTAIGWGLALYTPGAQSIGAALSAHAQGTAP